VSRSTIPRSHSASCICHACQAHRRKLRREAERPRRVPAENVSAVILAARAGGLTFREIAEVVDVSPSTIHRLTRGGAKVDPRTQRALEALEFVEPAKVPPKR
jgi:ribosome-binding protein aMBF1 (putative translation factor)